VGAYVGSELNGRDEPAICNGHASILSSNDLPRGAILDGVGACCSRRVDEVCRGQSYDDSACQGFTNKVESHLCELNSGHLDVDSNYRLEII
jgi:hypothetical protein